MTRRFSITLAIVAALGLVAGACDDDGPTAGEPSKSEFVETADEICAAGSEDVDDLPEPQTEEEFVDQVRDKFVPGVRASIEEIRGLGFPEGDTEQLDELFDRAEGALDEVEENPQRLLGEDDPFAEVTADLRDYGFTECGSG